MRCSVHAVYEGMWAAIDFRYRPPALSFRYGMNEIGDGLLAGWCDYTKALFEITFVCRLDCGKPAHIYKKPDFSHDDSMGKSILLVL
jgi:hypothetical protein